MERLDVPAAVGKYRRLPMEKEVLTESEVPACSAREIAGTSAG